MYLFPHQFYQSHLNTHMLEASLSLCVQERDGGHHLYHINSLAHVQKLSLYSENWVHCAVLASPINSFLIIHHTSKIFLVIATEAVQDLVTS